MARASGADGRVIAGFGCGERGLVRGAPFPSRSAWLALPASAARMGYLSFPPQWVTVNLLAFGATSTKR